MKTPHVTLPLAAAILLVGCPNISSASDSCALLQEELGQKTDASPEAALQASNRIKALNRACLAERSGGSPVPFSALVNPANRADKQVDTNAAAQAALEFHEIEAKAEKMEESSKFFGAGFSVGAGYAWATGSGRVESASVVDGVVRVDRDNSDRTILAFQAHYLLSTRPLPRASGSRKFGHGPFFAAIAKSASDAPIAIGLGYMISFSDPTDKEASRGWSLGLGLLAEQNVKRLGDGFSENAPPPGNETEVRFKESSGTSVFLLFSRTFGH